MKPETKEKVMQFIAAYEGKAFKNEDWEKQKSSFVFFHVMKKMGIVKPLYNNFFTIDKDKLNSLGYGAIFKAYDDYMKTKSQNRAIKKSAKPEIELLSQTLDQMPNGFSSHDFCTVLSAKGFSKAKIRKGAAAEYLRTVAIQTGKGARTWRKKPVQTQLSIHDINVPAATITEQGAIEHLKKLGYKIMKPINQWEEI